MIRGFLEHVWNVISLGRIAGGANIKTQIPRTFVRIQYAR